MVNARKYKLASVYILSEYGKHSKFYKWTTLWRTDEISYVKDNKQVKVREGKGREGEGTIKSAHWADQWLLPPVDFVWEIKTEKSGRGSRLFS